MVDEAAFRRTLDSVNPRPCPFGKAILAQCCKCACVEKHYLAEREAPACADKAMHLQCLALHELLLRNAAFALRHIHEQEPLTHAQQMKLQCGGLLGLRRAMDGEVDVPDVSALVSAAHQLFGSLEALPYAQIVQSVASYVPRRPRQM